MKQSLLRSAIAFLLAFLLLSQNAAVAFAATTDIAGYPDETGEENVNIGEESLDIGADDPESAGDIVVEEVIEASESADPESESVEEGTAQPVGAALPGCLTFSSPEEFTLGFEKGGHWNGTLEYSLDGINWNTWVKGSAAKKAKTTEGVYTIYLRGMKNSNICGLSIPSEAIYYEDGFVITGKDVHCTGNIETLLDYQQVSLGMHPNMTYYCFNGLFSGCTTLV